MKAIQPLGSKARGRGTASLWQPGPAQPRAVISGAVADVTYRETLDFLPGRSVSPSAAWPGAAVAQPDRPVPTASGNNPGGVADQPAGLAVK